MRDPPTQPRSRSVDLTHTIKIKTMHERPTDVSQEQVGRPHTHQKQNRINA